MTTLIFPSSMDISLRFYRKAIEKGEKVVAASSFAYDEMSSNYENYFQLPNIFDNSFLNELKNNILNHSIKEIYCPHQTIYRYLTKIKDSGDLSIPIIGEDPLYSQEKYHQELLDKANKIYNNLTHQLGNNSIIPPIKIASILKHYSNIYGQINESKAIYLIFAFASAPKGDVVEIGTFYGKSAFVLSSLAQYYNIGNTLFIDPWSPTGTSQPNALDSKQGVAPQPNNDTAFKAFCMNLLPYSNNNINYLKLTSAEAINHYNENKTVTSDEFGSVKYQQKISVLHIDGNHEYDFVLQDYELWRPHIVSNGWIILDDYFWLAGDGPKKMGDKILAEEANRIHNSFCAGKAMFLQLK